MGIFTLLMLVTVAAVVFATLFVTNSNYLDTSINQDLDVMKHLGIQMEMTPDMRKRVNDLLIPKLNILTRSNIIMAESARLNRRSFTTETPPIEPSPESSDKTSSKREEKLSLTPPTRVE